MLDDTCPVAGSTTVLFAWTHRISHTYPHYPHHDFIPSIPHLSLSSSFLFRRYSSPGGFQPAACRRCILILPWRYCTWRPSRLASPSMAFRDSWSIRGRPPLNPDSFCLRPPTLDKTGDHTGRIVAGVDTTLTQDRTHLDWRRLYALRRALRHFLFFDIVAMSISAPALCPRLHLAARPLY